MKFRNAVLSAAGVLVFSAACFAQTTSIEGDVIGPDGKPMANAKCVVIDQTFPWGNDRSPRIPWNRTVIYECHVKGMTKLHPAVPEHLRGTYLGLCSEKVIEHLQGLGVTSVELLPLNVPFQSS